MEYRALGDTGILVSRICAGTGTACYGGRSKQAMIPVPEYASLLEKAFEMGVNFWDTAEDYGSHSHVAEGMRLVGRKNIVLATKSLAFRRREIRASLDSSLKDLGAEYVDIFIMHAVDSLEDLKRREEVLDEMRSFKEKGYIRAVGLSTHTIKVLEEVVKLNLLDVLLTNFNPFEVHMDASIERYTRALSKGYESGKGIYVMKTLGEGRISGKAFEAISYNINCSFIHSVSIGIVKERDILEASMIMKKIESERLTKN